MAVVSHAFESGRRLWREYEHGRGRDARCFWQNSTEEILMLSLTCSAACLILETPPETAERDRLRLLTLTARGSAAKSLKCESQHWLSLHDNPAVVFR